MTGFFHCNLSTPSKITKVQSVESVEESAEHFEQPVEFVKSAHVAELACTCKCTCSVSQVAKEAENIGDGLKDDVKQATHTEAGTGADTADGIRGRESLLIDRGRPRFSRSPSTSPVNPPTTTQAPIEIEAEADPEPLTTRHLTFESFPSRDDIQLQHADEVSWPSSQRQSTCSPPRPPTPYPSDTAGERGHRQSRRRSIVALQSGFREAWFIVGNVFGTLSTRSSDTEKDTEFGYSLHRCRARSEQDPDLSPSLTLSLPSEQGDFGSSPGPSTTLQ